MPRGFCLFNEENVRGKFVCATWAEIYPCVFFYLDLGFELVVSISGEERSPREDFLIGTSAFILEMRSTHWIPDGLSFSSSFPYGETGSRVCLVPAPGPVQGAFVSVDGPNNAKPCR